MKRALTRAAVRSDETPWPAPNCGPAWGVRGVLPAVVGRSGSVRQGSGVQATPRGGIAGADCTMLGPGGLKGLHRNGRNGSPCAKGGSGSGVDWILLSSYVSRMLCWACSCLWQLELSTYRAVPHLDRYGC